MRSRILAVLFVLRLQRRARLGRSLRDVSTLTAAPGPAAKRGRDPGTSSSSDGYGSSSDSSDASLFECRECCCPLSRDQMADLPLGVVACRPCGAEVMRAINERFPLSSYADAVMATSARPTKPPAKRGATEGVSGWRAGFLR